MNWLEEQAKFYRGIRENPQARMEERMADMECQLMPAWSILDEALDTPKQEVVRFYKNINDKTELYLRKQIAEIKRELQEHYSQVHSNKKRSSKYD